ncbi:hypothetical protein R3P38DRAFT_3244178 [Favolaschia claudopus]|uniref:Uncharacterized protein n=1 Tax=Favolaschia claudopus TaxID=2862362 RepID=A0AAV9Z248_9AGAR
MDGHVPVKYLQLHGLNPHPHASFPPPLRYSHTLLPHPIPNTPLVHTRPSLRAPHFPFYLASPSTHHLVRKLQPFLVVLLVILSFCFPVLLAPLLLGVVCSTFPSSPSQRTPSESFHPSSTHNYVGMYLISPHSLNVSHSLSHNPSPPSTSTPPSTLSLNNERKRG